MSAKPDTCASCPLYHKGQGFVPDSGVAKEAVFWGEAPGRKEVEQSTPFVGPAGFVLKHWLLPAAAQLQQDACRFQNVLRCLPPEKHGRAYPSGEEQRLAEACCRQYDQPSSCTQVLCGEFPQRLHFGEDLRQEDILDKARGRDAKGVLGRIGRVYERDGKKWVFAPHPSWVLRNPYAVEAGQEAIRIAFNPTRYVETEYVPWDQAKGILANYEHPIGSDSEWTPDGITVSAIAWDGGRKATHFTPDQLKYLLRGDNQIVGHSLFEADLPKLVEAGVSLPKSRCFDTRIVHYVTAAHLAGTGLYDLRSTVLLCGRRGEERFPLDWKRYELDLYGTCREDAAASLWCSEQLKRRVEVYGLQPTLDISQRCAPIFALMREQGLKLNAAKLELIHQERKKKQAALIEANGLTEIRGKKKLKVVPIWRSPKILELFQTRYGVKPKNKKRETWVALARDRSIPEEARALANVLANLSEGANDAAWLGKVTETEEGLEFGKVDSAGYIHPRYDLCGSPDRPVASEPNINFPRVEEDTRAVPLRSAVVPRDKGLAWLAVDFSSVESYTTAIEFGDKKRLEFIQRLGKKFHDWTAARVNEALGLSLTRDQGKTVNHALDKGMSTWELARHLLGNQSKASVQLCARVVNLVLHEFPATMAFREDLYEKCRQNPVVVTNCFGRRLKVFSRGSEEKDVRDAWKRALAFLGRSSAVDVLLRKMCVIYEQSRLDSYSLPVLEQHDELGFEVPQEYAEKYGEVVKRTFMEPVEELDNIVLPAEIGVGDSWATAK